MGNQPPKVQKITKIPTQLGYLKKKTLCHHSPRGPFRNLDFANVGSAPHGTLPGKGTIRKLKGTKKPFLLVLPNLLPIRLTYSFLIIFTHKNKKAAITWKNNTFFQPWTNVKYTSNTAVL